MENDRNSPTIGTVGDDQSDSHWRAKYLEMVRKELARLNALDNLVGEEHEPVPPCFFYGTLMALPVLYNVVYHSPEPPEHMINHLTVRPAILKDHRRRLVLYCEYPGLTAHPGSQVAGSFVCGLTKANLRELHRFEGREYELVPIKVDVLMERTLGPPGPDGKPTYENEIWKEMDAMTYIYIAGEHRLVDREWCFQNYMENHLSSWSGLRASSVSNQRFDARGYWKDAVVVPKTED
ncbi:hypothetical protein L211DRAFT_819835 [Terfezia boudieri ATCC MYA-4762]|uniref:Putative gamma-glutamylcyclotransferase n=1 Tax=Terfezia boudieri ATCC MYA-4762 TaxID=1051890 RepID=A0A3N4MBR9_9PEZI|nr:hypothetical protein L211DRAFT_819835 [Terfezia boudieri ATCC MYA-4762]